MEQISYLGFTNTVYKAPFDLNVEIMRYFLIREKLGINPLNKSEISTLKKPREMIMSAFSYYYENSKDFKNPRDPFLFLLPSTTESSTFFKSYEVYNSLVNEILEELEEIKQSKESILKTKSITISIKHLGVRDSNSTLFEIYLDSKDSKTKLFSQKIYYTKFEKFKKYKYQMLAALLRYDILGFLGNASAAESPEKYEKLKKEGYNVELFGSFYNAYMDKYFGLFYDLEHHFGCLGNLFTSKLHYGKFVCNPPFNIYIMNRLVNFLLENSKNKKDFKELQVYITVPVWYKEDREKLGKFETYSETAEFHKELLKPYIIKDEIHLQKDYEFYSYLTGKYRGLCDVNNFVVKL